MPSVVRRQTSLTMRHRFTPAITFSTTTRALEMRGWRHLSSTLNAWPYGFFWLSGPHARRLRALKARLLVARGMARRGNLPLIGRLLVVLFPGHGRPQRDDFGGVCVHQQDGLVRLGCLRAAVLLLVLRGLGWTLTTALGAVNGHIGGALQRQGAGGNPARVALRRHTESDDGARQDCWGRRGEKAVCLPSVARCRWPHPRHDAGAACPPRSLLADTAG